MTQIQPCDVMHGMCQPAEPSRHGLGTVSCGYIITPPGEKVNNNEKRPCCYFALRIHNLFLPRLTVTFLWLDGASNSTVNSYCAVIRGEIDLPK